ncbi:LacI family DNA-binding transcriptional regulator [Jeotgalibacillus sp. S-D1]|uniref:LacI family DNA-binding transcriptional regulator n=1 Tax=Jeotgalibacillus sp. S-D1 TaxID=2552189 RepID=UPI00105A7FBE|nr:LacI family DNA-binding transcriptional regulator [Jeotgalibacillus sp. S-D1]TDL31878.1 LacI family DNA-binding transcriptional regulator [Jeotgalibacillus sp. S-D1]
MATIRDIAVRVNVSAATVSRVLNHDDTLSASPVTKEKIFETAKELNYQTLKSRRKQSMIQLKEAANKERIKLGMILLQSKEEEANDPYWLSIREGIEKECSTRGIDSLKLIRLQNLPAWQKEFCELDGLIIIGRMDFHILKSINQYNSNIVLINQDSHDDQYDSIIFDYEKAASLAMDHLIEAGYSRIGYLGGKEKISIEDIQVIKKNYSLDARKSIYESKMKQRKLYDENLMFIKEYSIQSGYDLMKQAIAKGDLPEAFFIGSDSMAIGALRALQESKIRIPEDVAIVSFNDIEMANFTSPPLTTVKIPTEDMGRLSVKLMIDRLEGRTIPVKVMVPSKLVIRESCGSLKAQMC